MAHTMVSGGQMPSQGPDRGGSPAMWAYKPLRTKYLGVFGDSYVPQGTPYNQQESITSSCATRSHPWELLRFSRLRRSVQDNSAPPYANACTSALTSGLIDWSNHCTRLHPPWRR